MFDKLITLASSKAYEMLKSRGAMCPDCGKPLALPENLPKAGFKSTIKCGHCPWMGSFSSLNRSDRDQQSATSVKPDGSKIRETIGIQKASWLIPAKKKVNFLMVFGLIWVGFVAFMTVGMITGDVSMEGGGEAPSWLVGLFIIPFWAIGLGVGYTGLRMSYTELLVRVDEKQVVLTRRFFKKMWDKSFPREQVGRVHLSVAYQQNNSPVYQIEIDNREGKNIKFGSSLKTDEKRWLLGELQGFLYDEDGDSAEHSDARGARNAYVGGGGRLQTGNDLASKTLKMEEIGRAGFRVTRTYTSGPWLSGIGFAMMIGTMIGMVAQWEHFDFEGEFGVAQIFDLLFSGIPFLMTLAGFLIGFGLAMWGYWAWGRKKMYEFGSDRLTLIELHRSNRKKESFDRASFVSVSTSNSGHVNNDPRFKVTLVGEQQSLAICDYENADLADSLEFRIQQWLNNV